MAGKTDYWEDKVLAHTLGKTDIGALPSVWVGLFTAAPNDAYTSGSPTGTEVSGGSYARKSTAGSDWNAPSGGSATNALAITFATPSGSWGTVAHFGLFDASSGGNLLMWGALTTSKTIGSGDTAAFAAGALTATED